MEITLEQIIKKERIFAPEGEDYTYPKITQRIRTVDDLFNKALITSDVNDIDKYIKSFGIETTTRYVNHYWGWITSQKRPILLQTKIVDDYEIKGYVNGKVLQIAMANIDSLARKPFILAWLQGLFDEDIENIFIPRNDALYHYNINKVNFPHEKYPKFWNYYTGSLSYPDTLDCSFRISKEYYHLFNIM